MSGRLSVTEMWFRSDMVKIGFALSNMKLKVYLFLEVRQTRNSNDKREKANDGNNKDRRERERIEME